MAQEEGQEFKHKAMIRNRRMRKMQELMEQGDYFSASSLETRAPSLFYDYVGRHQHLSNHPKYHNSSSTPSANFIESRDLCDGVKRGAGEGRRLGSTARTVGGRMVNGDGEQVEDDVPVCLQPGQWREEKGGQALADFLLHSMDKRENRLRRQRENSDYALATPESESGSENDEIEGEEEEKELSGDELERLRMEFLRLMQERFLDGMDAEYFDYQECDMDAGLDDLDAIDRDAEDAYFSNETASYDGVILEEMEGVERVGRGCNAWPHNRFLCTNSNSLIY